ncbi:hypothetical protein BC830DRAFT_1049569, partial [Chytriomyces sp. MP71]
WWDRIQAAYMEPQRRYHSLSHIEYLWQLYQTHATLCHATRPHVFLNAIVFHDIVYEPESKRNEEESASLFCQFAAEFPSLLSDSEVELVKTMILATIKHQLPDASIIILNKDQLDAVALFLDLDLSILSADQWHAYQTYSKGIRHEYLCFNDDEYRKGRLAVLKRFSARASLYFTTQLKDEWNKKAHSNIEREIQIL